MMYSLPNIRPVVFMIGIMLIILGLGMLLPALVDLSVGNPDWWIFSISAAATAYVGGLFVVANRTVEIKLGLREGFVLTTGAWIVVSAFGAIPFVFSAANLTYTDAFFESVSGLTTTGSTVLIGLETMPPGLLMWRGILQWLGGFGIIGTAIAMLPFLRIGGMQLFRMESSDRSEKILPRPSQVAQRIGTVYLCLTIACGLLYMAAGMSGFDAAVHAMTTLSTGGFSNFDASMGTFQQPAIDWIAIGFMILGSLPFILYVRFLLGDLGVIWRDSQVRTFLIMLLVVTLMMTLWLTAKTDFPFLESLRHSAFNVVSIVTTTGFVSTDYGEWIQGTEILFLLLTFVGGCTGSTAGAIKVFRFQFLRIVATRQLIRMIYPHAVLPLNYNGRPASPDVATSVTSYLFVFVASFAGLTVALSALGLDFLTSLSGAATSLCNVGPGLGTIIGPAGNFATLPDGAKWLLSLGMLIGRLELFTVLVLLTPSFWRG